MRIRAAAWNAVSTVAMALAALTMAACDTAILPTAPPPTWPVQPETLVTASEPVSAEFGAATWALDPQFGAPTADTATLHILVWESACSSGSPATGRMSAATLRFEPTVLTITIGVRGLDGVQACPGPPGTPAIINLSQPLGARSLRDGGRTPPGPPSAP